MLPYDLVRTYLPEQFPLSASINYGLRVVYIRLKYLLKGFPSGMHHFRTRNLIFIHIPKNAGSSISRSLYGRGLPHTSALYYRLINPKSFAQIESFALFRDPIERFCSAFNYLKYRSSHLADVKFREQYLKDVNSLSDFIAKLKTDPDLKAKVLSYPHFRTQSEFVCDLKGRVIVNQIGHLTHLKQFISAIESHIDDECAVEHLNKSAAIKKTSEADECYIRKLYAVDFVLQERILASENKILKTRLVVSSRTQP